MRKAILDSQNKLIDIRSEYNGVQKNIDITEAQVQEFLNYLNNEYFVFYDDLTSEFYHKKNIFKIKEKLRKEREKDYEKVNIYTEANNWEKLTQEQKQIVDTYKKDLADYVNKINSIEDLKTVPYPEFPQIDIGINII